jgi:hypothetical protein
MKEEKLIAYFDTKLKKRQILCRYLDLPKFVDFLRTGELYLEQASHFDDYLEGTLPEKIRQSICELPGFLDRHGDPSDWEHENKNRTCLSCWSLGSKDNMSLWKIYGGTTKSVAITTTVNRLILTAPSWGKFGRVNVTKVRYIDHAGRLPNGVYAMDESVFGLKHVAYSFEKEVRIVVTRPIGEVPGSIRLPVNLEQFLVKIVVAPEADEWFFDLIVDVARRYKVVAPVQRSALTFLLNKAKVSTNGTGQPIISPDR